MDSIKFDGVSKEEMLGIVKGRATLYEFFSIAYREPWIIEFIYALEELIKYFEMLATELPEVEELQAGVDAINSVLSTVDDVDKFAVQIKTNYTSLFLLGSMSVAPYESVYTSSAQLLKQEAWEDVMQIYAKYKLGIPADFKNPEDHISIELLFMSFISNKVAVALEEGNSELFHDLIDEKEKFLSMHLLRWAPRLCEDILSARKRSSETQNEYTLIEAITLLFKGYLIYLQDN